MNPLDLVKNPADFNALIERAKEDLSVLDEIEYERGHNILHYAAQTNLNVFRNAVNMLMINPGVRGEDIFKLLSAKAQKISSSDLSIDEDHPFGIKPLNAFVPAQKFAGYTPLHYALSFGKFDIASFIYDNCRHVSRGGEILLSHINPLGLTAAEMIISEPKGFNDHKMSQEMVVASYKCQFGDNLELLSDAIIAKPWIATSVISRVGTLNAFEIFSNFSKEAGAARELADTLCEIYQKNGPEAARAATREYEHDARARAAAEEVAQVEAEAEAEADAEEVAQVEAPADAEEVAQVEAPAALAPEAPAAEVEVAGDLLVQNADMFA